LFNYYLKTNGFYFRIIIKQFKYNWNKILQIGNTTFRVRVRVSVRVSVSENTFLVIYGHSGKWTASLRFIDDYSPENEHSLFWIYNNNNII